MTSKNGGTCRFFIFTAQSTENDEIAADKRIKAFVFLQDLWK